MIKKKYALISFFLFLTLSNQYVHAQVLEDYGTAWKEGNQKSWFKDNDRIEVELDLMTFPQSFLSFKIPANSFVFQGESLWFFSKSDTVFFQRLEDFRKNITEDRISVVVLKQGIEVGDVQIKKLLQKQDLHLVTETDEIPIKGRDLGQREIKNFFVFAVFLIFGGVALYKTTYPYFFQEMVRPLSLGENFSETGSFQKFFNFDILLFLFLVCLLLSLSSVLGLYINKLNWLQSRIDLNLVSLLWLWSLGTVILNVLIVFKFFGIRLVAYLFALEKLEFPHFFYLLRLVSIVSTLFVLISSYFLVYDFFGFHEVLTFSFSAFFWVYLAGIGGLFLLMANQLDFKKYHLFAYLCIAELVPFLILSKWIMDLGH